MAASWRGIEMKRSSWSDGKIKEVAELYVWTSGYKAETLPSRPGEMKTVETAVSALKNPQREYVVFFVSKTVIHFHVRRVRGRWR
jgi:hypothetical protein